MKKTKEEVFLEYVYLKAKAKEDFSLPFSKAALQKELLYSPKMIYSLTQILFKINFLKKIDDDTFTITPLGIEAAERNLELG